MLKNKKKYIYSASVICLIAVITFILFLSRHTDTEVIKLGSLENYTPIAFDDKTITYNYLSNDDTFTIGNYYIDLEKEKNIASKDDFYITYGIPAQIQNKVYLPITLDNNEHNLIRIDLTNNKVETIFTDYNSEPLDSISTMSDSIYMLSGDIDKNGIYSSYIRRYNDITQQMEICVLEKSINKDNGKIIKSFACNNGKIYAVIEDKNSTSKDIYINVYDGEEFTFLNKIYFDEGIKSSVLSNDIVQFYSYGEYFYIRDFSDTGIVGKLKDNCITTILTLPQLRIAYNNKNTNDEYFVFFIRESNELYILDTMNDDILKSNLQLAENESIRNAISDGSNLCVSILDDSNTDSYVTKETHIYSYEQLLELSK